MQRAKDGGTASLHLSSLSNCKGITACQNVKTHLIEMVVHKQEQGLQNIHCSKMQHIHCLKTHEVLSRSLFIPTLNKPETCKARRSCLFYFVFHSRGGCDSMERQFGGP
uniref:Uncharacterized protein n=1 Tax=Micrurus carvalhoi TaxID=3147026 RepID=A0A2H6N001_9SAUR